MSTPDDALMNYRRRALRATLGGSVAFVVGSATIPVLGRVGAAVGIFGAMAFFGGLVGVIRTVRVKRLAVRHGWRFRTAAFGVAGPGNGQPALVLLPSADEPEAVLSVATTVWRWGALVDVSTVWLTGDPLTRFAAVSPGDFVTVVVVKRPIMKRWRSRLRRIALGSQET